MTKREYTPELRAIYARSLRAARDHMWNGDGPSPRPMVGEHKFICQALVKASLVGDITKADRLATTLEVTARINCRVNLEDYLYADHGIPLQDDHTMQGLRFLWIEQMIMEFER